MSTQVVDLARFRRRKLGLRPELKLIGLRSSAEVVVKTALTASDPEDRRLLFDQMVAGSYSQMIVTLVSFFEINDKDVTRDVG